MGKRTTIEDVARKALVGKVTVSYVLNGRADEVGISKATTQRIIEAARELDYRPNGVARMLAKKRSDTIAAVFQHAHYFSLSSTFLNEALRAVCEECVEQEVDLLLHTRPAEQLESEADQLSDGRVDGVLMLRDFDDPTLAALLRRSFPVVLFFSRSPDPAVPFVDCDNFSGGKLAAQHLLDLGHSNFGAVMGSRKSVDSSDRLQGFKSTIESAGCSVPDNKIVEMVNASASPADLIELLKRDDRPTALFIWSDDVAIACYKVVRNLGMKIPDDISLVGFDSTSACDLVDPALTSVRQPIGEMAKAATRILCSITRRKAEYPNRLVFPPVLDVRGSTSSPKLS